MTAELRPVPSYELEVWWPDCVRHIEMATDRSGGRFNPDGIYVAIAERDMQLWAALDAGAVCGIMVTELQKYRTGLSACSVILMAADNFESVREHLVEIADWARTEGATKMDFIGRGGWRKVLSDWKYAGVLMEYEL